MPDTPQPGSPRFYLDMLYARLIAERGKLDKLDRYHDGKHKLAFATPKFRATFGSLFTAFSDNWCPIVVEASTERMEIQGFRAIGAKDALPAAWDLWQRNYLDADANLALYEAVKLGRSYLIVAPPERGQEFGRITVEHASQVIIAYAAGDRRRRLAALKVWMEDDGHIMATVYMPTAVYRFQSQAKVDQTGAITVEWIERKGTPHKVTHPFKVVPVIEVPNKPSMLKGGSSDMDPVIPLNDAVNKLVLDMLVASEYAAFRQRWATGIELPTDDDGNPVDEERFLSFVGRIWAVEDPEAKFGEFGVTDLSNYVGAIGLLIEHMSAQTRTPPHYLVGKVQNVSGDTLTAAETGLVSKVKGKLPFMGPAFGEAVALALPDRSQERILPIWRSPESRSVGELMDAGVKMQALHVPDEAVWEFIGATPEQIAEWKTAREAALLAEQALLLAGARPTDQGLGDDAGDAGTHAAVPQGGEDVAR